MPMVAAVLGVWGEQVVAVGGRKTVGKITRIKRSNRGIVDQGKGFGLIFGSVLDLSKIKDGPKFIVDIVSFQATLRSSNLVMF